MPMLTTKFKCWKILYEHLSVPYGMAFNYTIRFCTEIQCIEKNCCWIKFGFVLQKSPGLKTLVSPTAEAGNAYSLSHGTGN